MRCRACNKNLTDREASTKYKDWQEIKDSSQWYIELCDTCIKDTGLSGIENPLTSNEEIQDENETNEDDLEQS